MWLHMIFWPENFNDFPGIKRITRHKVHYKTKKKKLNLSSLLFFWKDKNKIEDNILKNQCISIIITKSNKFFVVFCERKN